MNKVTTNENGFIRSTIWQKVGYALQVTGDQYFWTFVAGFLTLYYTNSVGLGAAAVGTMMLLARILDGFTDIVMGAILEKTPNLKFGKCRLWMMISIPIIVIGMLVAFNVPSGLSDNGKLIYAYVTYIFISAIAFTIYGIPEGVSQTRMSTDPHDINVLAGIKMFFALGNGTFVYMIATKILEANGGYAIQTGWSKVTLLFAIIVGVSSVVGIMMMKDNLYKKEKEDAEKLTASGKMEKVPMKVALKSVTTIPEFWLLLFIFLCAYANAGLGGGSGMYFFGYVIGDWSAISLQALGSTIVGLVVVFLSPYMSNKFGKLPVMRIAILVASIVGILRIFVTGDLWFYLVLSWIQAGLAMVLFTMQWSLLSDLIMYVVKKNGIRSEGFVSTVSSIGIKIGTGIGSALVGWLLAAGKFDASLAVQPESALTAIKFMAIVVPSIISFLAFIVLMFWKLEKKSKALDAAAGKDQA